MAAILKSLRRWTPLVALLSLFASTIFKLTGYEAGAHALDYVLSLGWTTPDPTVAPTIIAGAGALYKTWLVFSGYIWPKPEVI